MNTGRHLEAPGVSHEVKLVNHSLLRVAALLTGSALLLMNNTDMGHSPSVSAVETELIGVSETTPPTIEHYLTTTSTTLLPVNPLATEAPTSLPTETTTTVMPETTTTSEAQSAPELQAAAQSFASEELSLDARCSMAIADSQVVPPAGYSLVCGPDYNTSADGVTCSKYASSCFPLKDSSRPYLEPGQIYIHPDTDDSDEHWKYVVRHEVGHAHCVEEGDMSEICADAWVAKQGWPINP